MIYFDHAATSYPKSPYVRETVVRALHCYGANPGRGGYPMAMNTAEMLYRCRERAAALFGVPQASQVIFTPSCTVSLNIVIRSVFANGGRVVISDLEHNAVVRPLHAVIPHGIDTAHVTPGDEEATVEAFRRAITPRTKAIVCTHASNVLGCILPIRRLAELAHEHGIPIVVDAAQSAGHLPIDLQAQELDYVCAAGHKGIGGPMGTGLLLCNNERTLDPLTVGGTGSYSMSLDPPAELPDRLESGTQNVVGLCGLNAALEELSNGGMQQRASRVQCLYRQMYRQMTALEGITIYSPDPWKCATVPVLSFRVNGMHVSEVCDALAYYGIAARGGLHCAPSAHRTIDTIPEGTVRFSIGWGNTAGQVQESIRFLKKITENSLCFRHSYDKILDE